MSIDATMNRVIDGDEFMAVVSGLTVTQRADLCRVLLRVLGHRLKNPGCNDAQPVVDMRGMGETVLEAHRVAEAIGLVVKA